MRDANGTTIKTIKRQSRGRCPDGAPNPIDLYVGNRMRLRRQLLAISQEKLASLLGLTFQQIQKYEKGLNRIGASRLWDLCKVLGVDANYFFQDMPPEISEQSPRMFIYMGTNRDVDTTPLPTPIEKTSKAQKLLVNFFKIPNRTLAENIFDMIENLAKSQTYHPAEKNMDFKGPE